MKLHVLKIVNAMKLHNYHNRCYCFIQIVFLKQLPPLINSHLQSREICRPHCQLLRTIQNSIAYVRLSSVNGTIPPMRAVWYILVPKISMEHTAFPVM